MKYITQSAIIFFTLLAWTRDTESAQCLLSWGKIQNSIKMNNQISFKRKILAELVLLSKNLLVDNIPKANMKFVNCCAKSVSFTQSYLTKMLLGC
jgi:hypothetical protein